MLAVLPLLLASQGTDLPPCDQAKADQGIQLHLTECAHREHVIADRALNAQWRVTAAKMRELDARFAEYDWGRPAPEYFSSLLDAQRAWLKYRDTSCRLEGDMLIGGSMLPMVVSSCLARMTKARTEELEYLAGWPE